MKVYYTNSLCNRPLSTIFLPPILTALYYKCRPQTWNLWIKKDKRVSNELYSSIYTFFLHYTKQIKIKLCLDNIYSSIHGIWYYIFSPHVWSLDLFIVVLRISLCKYVFIFFTCFSIWTLLTYINLSRECTIIVSASNNFCFMETAVTHVINVLVIFVPLKRNYYI